MSCQFVPAVGQGLAAAIIEINFVDIATCNEGAQSRVALQEGNQHAMELREPTLQHIPLFGLAERSSRHRLVIKGGDAAESNNIH